MKPYRCIITITTRGTGTDVVDASRRQGATGGTILSGRGTGSTETRKFLSRFIEPEKEIVITLVEHDKAEAVMVGIQEALHLEEPGKGLVFSLPVEEVLGITKINPTKEKD